MLQAPRRPRSSEALQGLRSSSAQGCVEDGGKRSKCKAQHTEQSLQHEYRDQPLSVNFHGSSQDGSLERVLADAAALDQEPVRAGRYATSSDTDAVPGSASSPSAVHTVSDSSATKLKGKFRNYPCWWFPRRQSGTRRSEG